MFWSNSKVTLSQNVSFSLSNCLGQDWYATTIASGNITTWDWDFGDGGSSTTQDPNHAYASPGTYDVTLVVSSGNCSDQITLQATSFPNPVADYTTADVCVGTAATFTDNSSVTGSAI